MNRSEEKGVKMRSFYLGELTWQDVKEFLSDHGVVVVPVGSCEQHGPHLPLDTDAYDVFWLSQKAAQRAGCALEIKLGNSLLKDWQTC